MSIFCDFVSEVTFHSIYLVSEKKIPLSSLLLVLPCT